MRTNLKATERLALIAGGIAAVATGGVYWFLPDLPWWAYVGVWVVLLGSLHRTLVSMAADERIIDGERAER
ncbi:fatty acid desaturase [Chelatococcus caeni]|uniref:Fatty acid desaturase n=1 Tax=Chelatococcus caeni TaxID=1348468 RepID=A0A840C204_9HYPH|nr:hypothetical protein [Chelatococcus caeni]MBB4019585.1 fatty acid desaturase [Chelatococcus caeni]